MKEPHDEFIIACQRAIMEMVIPRLAHFYKEVEFYWPILENDNYFYSGAYQSTKYLNYSIGEIKTRIEEDKLLALICFEDSKLLVYNFANTFEKFSVDLSDPDVHLRAYDYLEKLIKSTL